MVEAHSGEVNESCGVLVVDDHPLARLALCDLVEATPGLELLAGLASGECALAFARGLSTPTLVVMDVRMPGMGGVEAAKRIADLGAGHVVVLVSSDETSSALLDDEGNIAFMAKSRVTGRWLRDAWQAQPS
jgi:two-component system, NarL family, invasion response regulator UvrY